MFSLGHVFCFAFTMLAPLHWQLQNTSAARTAVSVQHANQINGSECAKTSRQEQHIKQPTTTLHISNRLIVNLNILHMKKYYECQLQ